MVVNTVHKNELNKPIKVQTFELNCMYVDVEIKED